MHKTIEYAILAGLAHEPQSGYDLTKWLTLVASHFWPVVHSGIYPALAALEGAGLVLHKIVPSEQGPARKVYSLTEQGHEALLAWVDSPPPTAQVRDEQLVRALCYGFLPPERALARLEQVRFHHTERLAHYEALERQIRDEHATESGGGGDVSDANTGKLLVVRCGILYEQGYLRWCDEAAAIIVAANAYSDTFR